MQTKVMLSTIKYDLIANKTLFPMLTAGVLGFVIILMQNPALAVIKGMLLAGVLIYASLCDIKTREVPDYISVMLLMISFIGFEVANLPSMLIGGVVAFIPQIAPAIVRPSKAVGGADIKISTASAFLLGTGKGLFAIILGLTLAVVVMWVRRCNKPENRNEAFPLVPFLSIGTMIAYLI